MQFNRQADGTMEPLPKPSVDTGMGLERIAAVLQHVNSNYDIDLFRNLIASVAKVTGATDLTNKSLRVIADHIRSCAFLIADGVIRRMKTAATCCVASFAARFATATCWARKIPSSGNWLLRLST